MKNLQEVITAVSALEEALASQGAKIGELESLVAEQDEEIAVLNTKVEGIKVRDRGPKSTRTMTRHDAWRVMHGDLKGKSHKEAAKATGLSYGQVYSARGEYTFKDVKADEFSIQNSSKADEPKAEVTEPTAPVETAEAQTA